MLLLTNLLKNSFFFRNSNASHI